MENLIAKISLWLCHSARCLIFLIGIFFLVKNDTMMATADTHRNTVQSGHHSENAGTIETVIQLETIPKSISARVPVTLQFSLKDLTGNPLQGITVTHDRMLHIIIVSEDFSVFSHLHPEDFGAITPVMLKEARFTITYAFPKAGRYLIALDAAVKDNHFSKQLFVEVSGEPGMSSLKTDFTSEKNFGNYRVKFTSTPEHIKTGERTTLKYFIMEHDKPVPDLETYLAAPMHIAVMMVDLNNFIHAHGEIPGSSSMHHPVGHIHGTLQDKFGPEIEANVIFPVKGIYQIFSEFRHKGRVTVASFMVKVE